MQIQETEEINFETSENSGSLQDPLYHDKDDTVQQKETNLDYALFDSIDSIHPIDSQTLSYVGRPCLSQIEGVVEEISRIININGLSAQDKRRTIIKGLNTSLGTSLSDLKVYIWDKFEDVRAKLPHLSKKSIRRLGVPPNKGHNSAKEYHGIINYRIVSSTNDDHVFTNRSHECFAQKKIIREELNFHKNLGDNIEEISVDNSSKLHIGDTTVVSRYHQNLRLFISEKGPHTPTHDKYTYKITPCGYMKLKFEKESENNSRMTGADKREHIIYPTSGPLTIFMKPDRYIKSTIENHVNDILYGNIFSEFPGFLYISADRGPDWDLSYEISFIYYGLLWINSRCDGLCINSLAGNNSAFNEIEHSWSKMSNLLGGGLQINGKLQNGKSPSTEEEHKQVNEEAIELICRIIEDGSKRYNFPIECKKWGTEIGKQKDIFDRHKWNIFLESKNFDSEDNKKRKNLFQFFVEHSTRLENYILFLRCEQTSCKKCLKLPQVRAPQLLASLRNRGGSFFSPMKLDNRHFKSYLQMKSDNETFHLPKLYADSKEEISYCDLCKYWIFNSNAERERHFWFIHNGVPTPKYIKGRFICKWPNCEDKFHDSAYLLQKHKNKYKHKKEQKKNLEHKKEQKKQNSKRKEIENTQEPKKKRKDERDYTSSCIGKRVQVWFEDRGHYFVGTIREKQLENQYLIEWDDKRAKKNEIVELVKEHNNDDKSDTDRWNFCG